MGWIIAILVIVAGVLGYKLNGKININVTLEEDLVKAKAETKKAKDEYKGIEKTNNSLRTKLAASERANQRSSKEMKVVDVETVTPKKTRKPRKPRAKKD